MKELLSSLHISLMKLTSSLSRREKLLLGLLTSTLIFSASFSYGAVNQSKVDSIMQTINNAASNFSSQADRDTYYNRVYTGLSDAIDMLAVVRNNVGAMIGTPPVSVSPGNPGGNMGGETSTDALALCSSDTTVENLTWPSSNSLRMKISDTRSKVFKVVVPSTNSGTMYISYASSSKQGFRQPKLSYAVSQKKACAYTDSTLGYGNTLQ